MAVPPPYPEPPDSAPLDPPPLDPPPRRSWARVVASACFGAVLAAAVASSVAWALVPVPSTAQLERVTAELVGDDVELVRVDELHVDSTGLGPREIRGTFPARIPLDDAGVERILADARGSGWQTMVFRDPGGTFVEAVRGGLAADVSAAQVDLTSTVPRWVNLAVGAGGLLGGFAGGRLNLRRQRRPETPRGRRWRRAVASGLLLPLVVVAACVPLFSVLSGSARRVGDYASLASGVLLFLAVFWVPVAVLVGAVVWFWPARGGRASAADAVDSHARRA